MTANTYINDILQILFINIKVYLLIIINNYKYIKYIYVSQKLS